MDRRVCIGVLTGSLVAAWGSAAGQTAQRVYRVGILRRSVRPASAQDIQLTGLPTALRELGYSEGRNLVIEHRFAQGQLDRLPALARELVQARMDVIVAVSAPAIRAVREASAMTPIVMFGNFDPVALGFIPSLARPGGNVTGILIAPDGTLAGKRLELLTLMVPKTKRVAYLMMPPDDASIRLQLEETRKAATLLGVELAEVEVRDFDYARAFETLAARRPGALLVAGDTNFTRDRRLIVELAAQHRLPAMYEWREHVTDGGLMAYSTSLPMLYQRLAAQVDRILKGTKPGDLPVEQPMRFSLVINKTTAKALRLTVPQSLLLRADEVIE
ncbi:MAG: ABC transporter substrate-binding protein [Burkholderiaceae bacterium]